MEPKLLYRFNTSPPLATEGINSVSDKKGFVKNQFQQDYLINKFYTTFLILSFAV
jgi:hypothetical protein